jgi:hypothetical protein
VAGGDGLSFSPDLTHDGWKIEENHSQQCFLNFACLSDVCRSFVSVTGDELLAVREALQGAQALLALQAGIVLRC